MPSKKSKVKKSIKQGVKINIHIDQSKKTKGVAPKTPVARRMLPAYSPQPQGASYLGAHYPNVQPSTFQQTISTTPNPVDIGKVVYNTILDEQRKLQNQAYGFGGFQTAGAQANQLFDGQYRAGYNNKPIILEAGSSSTTNDINNAVSDNPTTNNLIEYNKLENRGQSLPEINENSITGLNADERRDNNLDNLVLHEKKSATEKKAEKALKNNLTTEEDEDEETLLSEITNKAEQEQKALEVQLATEEAQFIGRNLTKKIFENVAENYSITGMPTRRASIQILKDYVQELNNEFNTNYPYNFKGKGAREDLFRTIRIAILKANDEL